MSGAATVPDKYLRKYWSRFMAFGWKLGLALILLVCVSRFVLVLQANTSGNYAVIGIVMLLSAIIPFILLNRNGQREIGWKRATNRPWLLIALLSGLGFSIGLFFIGEFLYGSSIENWYVYIARSYKIPAGMGGNDKLLFFAIIALTGMTFSPVGEELFFRGVVHSSFARSAGDRKASIVDASAFALVHLSHFGIVYTDTGWSFLPLPAFIWVSSMFLVSLLFFTCRQRSGSILGAILCHAGFNLGMIWSIFYLL
ncbi:MAG: CPBP family intramembrane metalloprotease [Chitinophagaceae bacterium]|nr:MAG: CPBP family intramembrane metalloprotease [Chitinophagaceae bacterium]